MAFDLIEGFDNYAAAATITAGGKWGAPRTAGSATPTFGTGRYAGGCLRVTTVGSSGWFIPRTFLGGAQSRFAIGFAFRMSAVPTNGQLLRLMNSAATVLNNTFVLAIADTGVLAVGNAPTAVYGTNGAFAAQGTVPLGVDSWHWIELFFDTSTGSVSVWRNGALEFSATSGVTFPSPVHGFFIGSSGTSGSIVDIDDVFCDVGVPAGPYTPRGDCRVETFVPTAVDAAGTYTVSGAANAQTALSDRLDSSYVESSTLNDRILLDSSNTLLGNPVAIHAVNVNARALKNGAGSRAIKAALKSSATTALHGTEHFLSDQVGNYQSIFALDPNGNIAWTKAAVEAATFGVEITT